MSQTTSAQKLDDNQKTGLLVGLAMLRQDWDRRHRSFLDNFVPFAADCLRSAGSAGLSDEALRDCVMNRFGVDIPAAPLGTILGRMRKDGLATRSDGCNYPTRESEAREPLDQARKEQAREQKALAHKLTLFAQDEYGLDWDDDEGEQALRHFVENWSQSLALMRSEVSGRPYEPGELGRETDYVVSSFILTLDRDPEAYDWLMGVVKGSMVSAGLYLVPGDVEQRFKETTLYLDTPYLMELMTGEEATASAAEELLEMATDLGATLACFQHTAQELQGVLQAKAGEIRSSAKKGGRPDSGQLHERFGPTDLEAMADELPRTLGTYGIAIKPTPAWRGNPTTDEAELEATLQETVNYYRDNTREHDVKSLVAVHQIRGGAEPMRFEEAGALLITNNRDLVRGAGRHFGTWMNPHRVPVAVVDQEFATRLWLKSPTPRPDLPWKQLIADCRAAVDPPEGLWSLYLDAVDKLRERGEVDSNTYFVARCTTEARKELMRQTGGGDRDRMNTETAREVAEKTRANIEGPYKERAEEAQRRAEKLEREVEQREAEIARAEEERYNQGHRDGARKTERQLTERIAGLLAYGLAAVFFVSSIAATFFDALSMQGTVRLIVAVLTFSFGVMMAWFASFGGSAKSRLQDWLEPQVARWVTGGRADEG